jgi:hypothetical protein
LKKRIKTGRPEEIMAGLTLEKPATPDPKKANLTQCYDNERTYFQDGATGKCYSNKDMRVEIDPKTYAPIVAK